MPSRAARRADPRFVSMIFWTSLVSSIDMGGRDDTAQET